MTGGGNILVTGGAGYMASGRSQILLQDVPPLQAHKYGIAIPGSESGCVAGLVEEPSHLTSIGRYVLHPEIFDVLASLGPGTYGEIELTEAINALARRGRVGALPVDGGCHDYGSPSGYLGAIVAAASSHHEFGAEFRAITAAHLAAKAGEA